MYARMVGLGVSMTDKDLKKLSRVDLLRLLIQQTEENERLAARNARLEQELSRRTVILENSGSIAEAALGLSAVFAQAQDAADRYLESIREKNATTEQRLAEVDQRCAQMEAQTQEKCDALEQKTRQVCARLLQQAKHRAAQAAVAPDALPELSFGEEGRR